MQLPRFGSALALFVIASGYAPGWCNQPSTNPNDPPAEAQAQPAVEAVQNESTNPLLGLKSSLERTKATDPTVTDEQVSAARARANQAVKTLEGYLAKGGSEIEKGWKTYLNWQELNRQLASDDPDSQTIGTLANKFYEGHVGLERPKFVAARKSLASYVRLLAAKDPIVAKQIVHGQIDNLTSAIDSMVETPSVVTATQMNDVVTYLDSLGQIPSIANDFRRHYGLPNVYFSASRSLISSAIADVVTETRGVREIILGTNIRGTATTTGSLYGLLQPNSHGATIGITMNGVSYSNTVGSNGPVLIYSTGRTTVCSQAAIVFNDHGLSAVPATARCVTKTSINSIRSRRHRIGSRLIERVAWKRAGQQKRQGEQIASRRAEYHAANSMNRRIRQAVARGNQRMRDKIRRPLEIRNVYPRDVRVSSNGNAVRIQASQGLHHQFLASSTPPAMPQHRITAQVHESMVSNSAVNYMSGLLLTDELAASLSNEILGETPDSLRIKQDEDPWSITFDRQNPFVASFDDNQLTITVRGRRFTRADTTLERLMEISATYAITINGGRLHLVRQGELDVTYPAKKGQRLTVSDIAERNFVRNKFKSLFEEEIHGDGVPLPENLAKIGPLQLTHASTSDGWLSLGWN